MQQRGSKYFARSPPPPPHAHTHTYTPTYNPRPCGWDQ